MQKETGGAIAGVDREALPDSILKTLFDYYQSLPVEGVAPLRDSFDPSQIVRVLPWLVIYDIENDPRRYRVRLQGTGIVEAVGGEGTGCYLDEFPGMEDSMKRLDQLVCLGRPYFVRDLPMPWALRDYKTHHLLALPFSTDGESIDTIMLGLSFAN